MAGRRTPGGSVSPRLPYSEEHLAQLLSVHAKEIGEAADILAALRKRYRVSMEEVARAVTRTEYVSLPLGVFRSGLSPLEAVVRYLREALGYSLGEIAKMLRRAPSTIWTTYRNAQKAEWAVDRLEDLDFRRYPVKREQMVIPVSLLSSRKHSILEAVCLHLRDMDLGCTAIGRILGRDPRTIWTVIRRAEVKDAG